VTLHGVTLTAGGGPDDENEGNLVDEIGKIVDQVEQLGGDGTAEVAKEVTEGVDGPADGDDGAHGVEGGLDGSGGGVSLDLGSLTSENLGQNVEPTGATGNEHGEGHETSLANVAAGKHDDGSDQQTPENAAWDILAAGAEDEVELDHLERDGEGPIDVTVESGGDVVGNPVRAHVEVMHSGDEDDQSTNVQGGLPVTLQVLGFHEEEHGGANHGHGDDPESNTNEIMRSQELGGGHGEFRVNVGDKRGNIGVGRDQRGGQRSVGSGQAEPRGSIFPTSRHLEELA
jgi:hypothetical protein